MMFRTYSRERKATRFNMLRTKVTAITPKLRVECAIDVQTIFYKYIKYITLIPTPTHYTYIPNPSVEPNLEPEITYGPRLLVHAV